MNYKGLKDYQRLALATFADWLDALGRQREECARRVAGLAAQGAAVRPADRDFPAMAWEALSEAGKLPRVRDSRGAMIHPPYVSRLDARGGPIPHACLKVPTGGGKTLLGAAMVEALGPEAGVVLWVTPSRAIFRQTWGVLSDRTHNCRERLERACGGRVNLMRKDGVLSALAVESQLCVMPVMLQAAGGARGDFLKIFRDSSNTPRFFPEMDDIAGNERLLKAHPDLDKYDLGDGIGAGAVRHSLFNALKLARPIVVLDEAHNAYTDLQREKLCALNPRMILELSATPRIGKSNILVNVPGAALQEEQMIKLPLNVHHLEDSTWRATLTLAKERLDELAAAARNLRGDDGEGRYVRPMMLVRVERVGKRQRDGIHIHAEDVREFLLRLPAAKAEMVMRPDQIRVRTSEKDEIGGEDLLSPECPVRVVITKDALREGWDCPFAYILALLDTTAAPGALTQMTGRILRQPDAKKTGAPLLDESYVFCFNRGVGETVAQIKKGLESEGMADLQNQVRGGVGEKIDSPPKRIRTIPRREEFKGRRIFLPVVLHRHKRKFRELDYEADILRHVDWRGIAGTDLGLDLRTVDNMVETIVQVDFAGHAGLREIREVRSEEELSLVFFARCLGEVIPNPWLAADVATRALDSLREKAGGDAGLFKRRFRIAEAIKRKVAALVDREAERIFCGKLERGDIRLRLTAGEEDYDFPAESTAVVGEGESRLSGRDGGSLRKSLYGRVYEGAFNSLERAFAVHADGHGAVAWWHRLAANRESYALQGWRRGRVYPDFAVCVGEGENARILILETKGMHLSGNPDTEYKRALLEKLSATNPRALECGDLTLKSGRRERRMVLRVLLEKGWKEEFDKLAAE